MSKRDYFLQKGLQLQQLNEQTSASPAGPSSSGGGKAARDVAKYRELCPPGTADSQLSVLIGQAKGDAQRMENAISELWEDYRGGGQDDAWATVAKKTSKKKHDHPHASQRAYSSQKSQQQQHAEPAQDADDSPQPTTSPERFAIRGRGSMRGRGMASSRGGRGGRSGRGRGGAVVATGGPRSNRNGASGDNEEDSPENDNNSSTDGSNVVTEARVQPSSRAGKDAPSSKRDRGAKSVKTTTPPPVVEAPPVVYPVLTGAWAKKPNLTGVISKPKPVEPVSKPVEKPTPAADTNTATTDSATPEAPKSTSPTKKTQQDKKTKKTQKASSTAPVTEAVTVVEQTKTVEVVENVISPKVSPKKTVETTSTVETTVETTTSSIAAGWGTLDVSTSTIDEWPSSTPAATTEPKKVSTPNAWGRGSPVLTPPASSEITTAAKSPVAAARPTVVPGSPKDIQMPRSGGSAATSPKPYLKMGKWDSAASTNLSLQFGSFSLNGVEHVEATSPRGWASTTTTTTTTSSTNGGKTVTKATTTQSAWANSAKVASPKKTATLSPGRALDSEQRHTLEGAAAAVGAKTTTSAPPGLSVDSGRVTPTSAQSPRYTPSAPSPASLPKPDEVKRGTPTRAQGGSFQAQGGAAAQSSKMNIGYGADFGGAKPSGLYQASYGQYSMDLGRPAAAPATGAIPQGQLPTGSGTPKGTGSRGAASAAVASQSPSRGQQPVAQMQQIPLQQQAQQQQQQVQQQVQQKQAQQQQQVQQQAQQQQHAQAQQGQQSQAQQQTAAQLQQQAQAGMQQGYHHYAPPPPPGMALPYNPYNYASYYQGYGYYQNPQFAQYSPRTQYPPRGSMPYGVEGPVPGFSNPPNMPVGYQDQHLMAQQHEYAGAVPQGFGEISGAYLQQAPMQQQQGGHHGHHGHQQTGPQSHGKSGSGAAAGAAGSQQSHGQRSNSGMQGYQNASGRDHTSSPPVPNASAAMSGSYGQQHYGWAGTYGAQPVGGWGGHMMPQGYQQSPSQQQAQQGQQQQQQHPGSHQQYRQYGNGSSQGGSNAANDVNNAHSWSS